MGAKKAALDFTNVKEGGNFSKKHMAAGDYLAKITKVEDAMPKDKDDKTPMWLFTVQLVQTPSATYPYYCKLQDNQLWKVRNLLVAAGINVPKKKVGVDPNKLVGKLVAVSLDDTEYNDKEQSEVGAIFSPKELDGDAADDVDDVDDDDDDDEDTSVDVDDDDDDDEEEEPEPPKKTKKSKKKKPAPEPEPDGDDDDDEEDEAEGDQYDAMDRPALRRAVRKAVPGTKVSKAQSDDDLRNLLRGDEDTDEDEEDEEEEEAPKKSSKKSKKKAKPADDDDEDEDEIDIEDL